MPRRKVYGKPYKRRSQVYKKVRSKRLSSGRYLVEHEPTKFECVVFKRPEAKDWAIAGKAGDFLRSGFRNKNTAMEAVMRAGPKIAKVA